MTNKISNYDVIFGRDLLWELGIQIDFKNNFIQWQDINIPMTPLNYRISIHVTIQDSKNIRSATKKIEKILSANYEKANSKMLRVRLRDVMCYVIMTLFSTDPTAVYTHVCHTAP